MSEDPTGGTSDVPSAPGSRPAVDGSRATYRREVDARHVGERVSVRFFVDDAQLGPRPTDRVGRLLSVEDDGWIVVDRHATLHVIDPATIVASRIVPAHPRFAAEPTGGSEDAPIARDAARVLLLDPEDRVLLVAHLPGGGRTVWTAPGGGLDPGESYEVAAARELREEVGLDMAVGPWVWSRTATFTFRGVWLRQSERWFLVRTPAFDPDDVPLADLATSGARWWTLGELVEVARRADAEGSEGTEVLAPRTLPEHLGELLRTGPPSEPIDVGR